MSTRGSERRQDLRQAICLPVKVLFLGNHGAAGGPHSASMKAAPVASSDPAKTSPVSATEETPLHALALDVSALGCQLELSGVAGRRFREDIEMLPRLELLFAHEELKQYGARAGRVRWARHDKHGGWRVGLQLDGPLPDEALRDILWLGNPRPPEGRLGRDALVAVIAAAAATVIWYPAYRAETYEHQRVAAQRQTSEDQLLACIATRATETPARPEPIPADAASPATGEDLVRGLVERAFRADAGSLAGDEE